jgi:hypothetical protein
LAPGFHDFFFFSPLRKGDRPETAESRKGEIVLDMKEDEEKKNERRRARVRVN